MNRAFRFGNLVPGCFQKRWGQAHEKARPLSFNRLAMVVSLFCWIYEIAFINRSLLASGLLEQKNQDCLYYPPQSNVIS